MCESALVKYFTSPPPCVSPTHARKSVTANSTMVDPDWYGGTASRDGDAARELGFHEELNRVVATVACDHVMNWLRCSCSAAHRL